MIVSRRFICQLHKYKYYLKCAWISSRSISYFGNVTLKRQKYSNKCNLVFGGCTERTITENSTGTLKSSDFLKEVQEMNDAFPIVRAEILEIIPKKSSRERLENFCNICMALDDYLDNSINRRAQPCWYRTSDLNKNLIFPDTVVLKTALFALLHKYFAGRPSYDRMMESFFQETISCYYSFILEEECNLLLKNEKMFQEVTYYDLAYYKGSFCIRLPLLTALYLAGYKRIPHEDIIEKIIEECGIFLQANNDYQDTYEDAIHENHAQYQDAQQGKWVWPLYIAFQHGNNEQRSIIMNHYGRSDEESIQKIKNLYNEINIPEKFEDFSRKINNEIERNINSIPEEFLRSYLTDLVNELRNYFVKPKLYVK